MLDDVRADLRHYARYCYGVRASWSVLPKLIITHPAVVGVMWYRLGRAAWASHLHIWKQVLQLTYLAGLPLARIYSGVQIHIGAAIAPGLAILHFGGVVIAPGTKIGPDSLLHHNVNLVAYRDAAGPDIGARFYAGVGVTVVDNITIEDDVTAGAGSVITKSVPRDAVLAGAPARIIRFRKANEHPSENQTLGKRPVKPWLEPPGA
jgi:serine acetyltransferase